MTASSVHLATLGCRLNEAETESWARGFRARGLRIARDAAEADLVVLNTCAVTTEAVRKSRQWVRRLRRNNPNAQLVLSGCYATLVGAPALDADLVVDNADKDRLVDIAAERLPLFQGQPQDEPDSGADTLFQRNRQRAFIKVQDGCRYRCSFCIVTLARGEERSRPIVEVVEQVRALHADGIQEVVLAGVHLGGYGSDLRLRLSDLLRALLAETSVPRIRLGSLEPWELDDEFLRLFSDRRLMPHLHLPLQSGADSVLRRMARRCRTRAYADLLERAHRHIPDLHVSTDLIAGFPGETDAEWRQSLAFVRAMDIGQIHAFSYSPRQGTRAAERDDQIAPAVRATRMLELKQVATDMLRARLAREIGHIHQVLLENRCRQQAGQWLVQGYTPNWLRVELPVAKAPSDHQGSPRLHTARMRQVSDCGGLLQAEAVQV